MARKGAKFIANFSVLATKGAKFLANFSAIKLTSLPSLSLSLSLSLSVSTKRERGGEGREGEEDRSMFGVRLGARRGPSVF